MSQYTARKIAAPNTLEHRIYIEENGKPISPFHDIPLYANQEQTILNMIVEVPRWTNAKMEISKEETLNPIKQDIKKGKLRFVRNCFPHKGYLWNYGAFPQTWEDPSVEHPETKAKGDNDPLDVCEIGELVARPGDIKQVKVLGIMALIDEGETDWKVIGIDVTDPLAEKMNDISDVDKYMPGTIVATNEWFRIYKMPAGKPENEFAFKGAAKDKEFAKQIINETGEQWKTMQFGEGYKDLASVNSTQEGSKDYTTGPEKAAELIAKEPAATADAPLDPSVHKWHYITL